MRTNDVIAIVGLTLSIVVIPVLALLWRFNTKWTRFEMRIELLTDSMAKLVLDKDRAHVIIQDQVTKDREATDKRLRWLETHLWQRIGTERKEAA